MSGLPVGLYAQGAGGSALAARSRRRAAGADVIATAVYPIALALHRVSAEAVAQALAGLGLETGVDMDRLWGAADLVDEHIGDEPVAPLAPRIAVRAAQQKLPVGLVAALDQQLRAQAAGDRLDEVLDEVDQVREELGSPPLAAPIGQIVASQALAQRADARTATRRSSTRCATSSRPLRPHAGPDRPALPRAVELYGDEREAAPVDLDELRVEAGGLAASEEELLLLALFGEEAEPLLRSIRERSGGEESLAAGGVDQARAERIREVVRIVQETGRRRDHDRGGRHARERAPDGRAAPPPARRRPSTATERAGAARRSRRATTASCASRARWSGRSTARPHRARRRSSRRATPSPSGRRSASSRR